MSGGHAERKHALFSGSTAKRWTHCYGCALLTQDMPDTTSPAAEEGTKAAEIAERCLKTGTDAPEGYKQLDAYLSLVRMQADLVAMDEQDTSAGTVRIYPELNLTPALESAFVVPPESGLVGGTADCVIYSPAAKFLGVVDLKWGRGEVPAQDNEQLAYYLVGAIFNVGLNRVKDFDSWTLWAAISQPRLDAESPNDIWVIRESPVAFLQRWMKTFSEGIIRGQRPKQPLAAGDWCKFCKAEATCEERLKALNLALPDIPDAPAKAEDLISSQPIDRLVKLVANTQFINRCLKLARAKLIDECSRLGGTAHGYKIVAGRSTRKWDVTKEAEAAKALELMGENPYRLITVTEADKILGRKGTDKFIERTLGKPTLAPITDKRPVMLPTADLAMDDEDDGDNE